MGVDALAGMPQVFTRSGVTFARPLLTLTRDETTGLCEDLGVEYWDDPTNGDAVDGELPDDYPLRSRVRHDLLPAIERFAGFNVTRHFAESAQLARMDKEYLDQRSDEVMGEAVRQLTGRHRRQRYRPIRHEPVLQTIPTIRAMASA